MKLRFDERTLEDLVSDSGTPAPDLSIDTRLETALKVASGKINAAVLNGKQYSIEDLTALLADPLLEDDVELLKDVCCSLALAWLVRRRPEKYEAYKAMLAEADAYLQRFRKGEHVFNIERNKQAGLPSAEGFTHVEYDIEQGWRERYDGGFYPQRQLPIGR